MLKIYLASVSEHACVILSGGGIIKFPKSIKYSILLSFTYAFKLFSKTFYSCYYFNIYYFIIVILCLYILKENKYQPILILTLIASISIETTQLMIGRVFDIDDIMLNTVGGMIGYYIYILFLKVRDFYKPLLSKEWVLNIIAILLLAGFIKILL